ncbi:potassium channel family protein [Methylocystis echinoides]|uniref:Potassium channel domain-containing protein n=1 Tax=Methylocystis echinoides TaxID=29468 RepID=A0A9W6LU86_9HYPH|nr:potassium channel family protein [Methylocystis echinoides]GLI95393.1 hypothetical protein LMG27198_43850 [Methylocystis echinoides]
MAKAETNGAPATPRFLASPLRNLIAGVIILLGVSIAAAMAYVANGWELSDAIYMVVITVFSIGYREIGPVDTPALRAITIPSDLFEAQRGQRGSRRLPLSLERRVG